MRKKKLYLFNVVKNEQIFPSKVCYIQYDQRLFFSREMRTLEVARRYDWKILLNLCCQENIRFGFLKMLKNKVHLGRVSPSPFMHNVLI